MSYFVHVVVLSNTAINDMPKWVCRVFHIAMIGPWKHIAMHEAK